MYSQNNEEQVIGDFFDALPPRITIGSPARARAFLDLGANDGITLSNTYALFQRGWNGTLVEASPRVFKQLTENYLGAVDKIDLINNAIGKEAGPVVLNSSGALLGSGDSDLVSTIIPEEMERFKSVCTYEPVTVQCITFADLMTLTKYKTFDFISIDIEGCDLDVLVQMDLDALGCQCICIEWNGKFHLQHAYGQHVAKFDKLGKFEIIHINGENLIYGRA